MRDESLTGPPDLYGKDMKGLVMIRFLLSFLLISITSVPLVYAQSPTGDDNDPVIISLEKIDCSGHKGLKTVCVKNASTKTIVSAACGQYDVPLVGGKLEAGHTAAVVDLSNSVRTCRSEGITAQTSRGKVLHGKLNAASVDAATEVWFYDNQ